MSKIYKLSLIPKSGLLTDLQSDTIFGHLCWRLKDKYSEEKLAEFLRFYNDGNPIFTVSNSLFEKGDEIFFPKPFLPIKKEKLNENDSKRNKVIKFIDYKKNKKVKYLTLKQFNEILNYKNIEFDDNDFESIGFENELRVSVEIDRNTFSSKEGQLFSYSPKYIKDKNKEKDKANLCVFIKVIDEKNYEIYDCENLMKDVFELGFGKKKSSGYGEMEIKSFNIFEKFDEPDNANAFINLSNYLPSENDKIIDAYYDINVKYGKLGEEYALSSNPFKKPIIFLTPGSCFKTNVKKEFYGRCTKNGEISSIEHVIQNGIAFTLNFKGF